MFAKDWSLGILDPENNKVDVIFNNIAACSMQIKRKYYVSLVNQPFDLNMNILQLCDNDSDNISISNTSYLFNAIPKVIWKYCIISGSISVKSTQKTNGYLWASFSSLLITDNNRKKNLWGSSYKKINDGIRIVYIPDSFNFEFINEGQRSYYLSIFSEHNVSGTFEVIITKNINYMPFDTEMFVPYRNDKIVGDDLNEFRNKNIITNADGSA
jgi:hypothetical protein